MKNKLIIAAGTIALILILAVTEAQVTMANRIPWPSKPNLEKPTLTLKSPQNTTAFAYNDTDVWLNFTVTTPDSWKTGSFPPPYVGEVTSVQAYLNGNAIPKGPDLWLDFELRFNGSKTFTLKLNQSTVGSNTLNVTISGFTYYKQPSGDGSDILYYISSKGPVYKYPVVVSDIVYFTVNAAPSPLPQKTTSFPTATVAAISLLAVTLAGAGLMVYFKKPKRSFPIPQTF
jgi:hypothetical protein